MDSSNMANNLKKERVTFDIPQQQGQTSAGKKIIVRKIDPSTNLAEANRDFRQYTQPVYIYDGRIYPDYLRNGNAVQHIIPAAKHYCKGRGLDIGGTPDWHFPGAEIVNPAFGEFDAAKLPGKDYDYIFSSHTLEHIENYADALKLWRDALRPGGQLFLYLPHPDMVYWRPENCKKHVHSFTPQKVAYVLDKLGFVQIFYSNRDFYWSFAVTGVKPWA